MDFAAFVNMSGYAFNVWASYGLGVAGYGGLLVWALVQRDRTGK